MEIVEEGDRWVGFDGVVGFNPGQSDLPGLEFTLGLGLVIEQAACLHFVFFQDLVNLLGLQF